MHDVTEYGAVGDGEAIETDAVQEAVDAAHDAGGGTVRLPAGTYRVDGPVTMRSRVHLVGEGMGASTVVATGSGFSAIEYRGGPDDLLVDTTVADLTIDCAELGDSADYSPEEKCVYYQHVWRCQLRRVHAVGAPATGIGTDMMVDSLVEGCVAEDCGRQFAAARDGINVGSNGIGIGTGLLADAEPVVVANCNARGNANNGIMFENQATGDRENERHAGHLVVHGCTALDNRVGFRTSADRRVRIANCSAHANDEDGVVVDEKGDMPADVGRPPFPAREHRIDGCHVTENDGHGVHVVAADEDAHVAVSDCHVGANANAGVRVSAGEAVGSVSVANCHVYDNGGPGVAFADGGTDITVSHCQVRDNGSDGGAAGVRFGGPTRSATVAGCHLVDGAGSQAPAVAIEDDHESLVVRDNQFRGGAPILAADDLPVARENEGFVTEHAGVASAVGDGETRQFAIDHGLDVAPSVAEVWAESGGAAGDLYVAAADADQVVVAYPNAPAEGVTLRWGYEARLQR